jgi:hypothetical protein
MLHKNMMKTLENQLNGVSQAIPASATTVPNIKYWTIADYFELGKEKKHKLDVLEVKKGRVVEFLIYLSLFWTDLFS